jgi:glycosyltransferase involved in cell wall biosynthesis
MKKILVADWLDKYGGAERVLSVLNKCYEFDKCYTLLNIMSNADQSKVFQNKNIPIIESALKSLKSNFRYLFFLFPFFISRFKIAKGKSLIISSSFAVAKGFKKKEGQLHICYYQARNQRYIWDTENIYFKKWQRLILFPLLNYLKKIDIYQSKRPDYIISNSLFVKKWIKKTYNLDSHVIYPPVDTRLFKFQKNKSNYFITTARLEPYKRVDLIVDAFNKTDEILYVVGDGSMKKTLVKKANSNIVFFDYSNAKKVNELVGKAKAFIHAGIEDFGIAPVEAQSCGTPVIGFNGGGVAETVIDGKTGILFKFQTSDAILESLRRFKKVEFDYELISRHSKQFSEDVFMNNFKKFVQDKIRLNNLK